MAGNRTRLRIIPQPAFEKLQAWLDAKLGEADPTWLIEAEPESWISGLVHSPSLVRDPRGDFIRTVLNKPKGEGETERWLDPEGLALVMLLCLCGGRLAIENKGPDGGYYYERLYLNGAEPSGRQRRVYLLPIVASTPFGKLTVEPLDHHSLLRRDLGLCRESAEHEGARLYGAETAIRFALDRFREVEAGSPGALPSGLNEDRYTALLGAAHKRLQGVPLGQRKEEEAA